MTEEDKKQIVEIWSKTVATQMHFNEMCVKSRQLGLAFVAAALGVAIALLGKGEDFKVSATVCSVTINLHVSVLLAIAAMLALWAVRILDLNVYHRMLRGAVTFGEDFEEKYVKQIFQLEKGMTQAISHYSRFDDAQIEKRDTGYHYTGGIKKTAEQKIKAFYNFALIALGASAVLLFICTFR